MNLIILYHTTVKFKQTNEKRKNKLQLPLSAFWICVFAKPVFLIYLFKLQVASTLTVLMNSTFCLWEKHAILNLFGLLSLKTVRPVVRWHLFRILGWRHPGVRADGLWKCKQQVSLFSDYIRNQEFSYHSFYQNIQERSICVVNLNQDQIFNDQIKYLRKNTDVA